MANKEFVKLIDTSRCTACRGCQVACKQWNELPGLRTKNLGTYQNPPQLQWNTWTLMRFQEYEDTAGRFSWLFRKDGCMHCEEAGCMMVCPVPGCITRTPEGAVVLDSQKCIGCKYCYHACPFSIPQFDAATEKMFKCHLCHDRLAEGQIPSCAKSCPTGAITFGEKDKMIAAAYARVQKLGGTASVYGDKFVGGTHVVYVLTEPVAVYDSLPVDPKISPMIFIWKNILKPLSLLSLLGGIGGSILYYLIKGPKHPHFEQGGEGHEQ